MHSPLLSKSIAAAQLVILLLLLFLVIEAPGHPVHVVASRKLNRHILTMGWDGTVGPIRINGYIPSIVLSTAMGTLNRAFAFVFEQ